MRAIKIKGASVIERTKFRIKFSARHLLSSKMYLIFFPENLSFFNGNFTQVQMSHRRIPISIFAPAGKIRGIFGDPKTRIITLVRRSNKQSATLAAERAWPGTTSTQQRDPIPP